MKHCYDLKIFRKSAVSIDNSIVKANMNKENFYLFWLNHLLVILLHSSTFARPSETLYSSSFCYHHYNQIVHHPKTHIDPVKLQISEFLNHCKMLDI